MCHALNKRCGLAARFVLNYDFVFLAMLLSDSDGPPLYEYKRCIINPFKNRTCCAPVSAMEQAADCSVILTYWKLRDTIADEGFISSLPSRIFSWVLRRAYKKAVSREPEFDAFVCKKLSELDKLESEKCRSIDITADKFALILQNAAECVTAEPKRRTLRELLYHTGRIVYLLDAVDDLERDASCGAYNPLLYRFDTCGGVLSDPDKLTMNRTIEHSQMLMASAFELLDTGPWTEILANIIYIGIPWVSSQVFAGQWEQPRRGLPPARKLPPAEKP